MTMQLDYDTESDAAFVYLDGPLTPDRTDGTEQLDQDRLIRFGAGDRILAYEFLRVRRHGVRLDDLEHRDDLRRVFREAGVPERDWSAPLPTPRPKAQA